MSSSQQTSGAARLLSRQLNEMKKAKDLAGVSVGLVNDNNVFAWQVGIMINDDCKYYGGMFRFQPATLFLLLLLPQGSRP